MFTVLQIPTADSQDGLDYLEPEEGLGRESLLLFSMPRTARIDYLCRKSHIKSSIRAILRKDPRLSSATVRRLETLTGKTADKGNWDLSVAMGSTWALISACIKEDLTQSLAELSIRVARSKGVNIVEAARHIRLLANDGLLFYYSSIYRPIKWPDDRSRGQSNGPAVKRKHTPADYYLALG